MQEEGQVTTSCATTKVKSSPSTEKWHVRFVRLMTMSIENMRTPSFQWIYKSNSIVISNRHILSSTIKFNRLAAISKISFCRKEVSMKLWYMVDMLRSGNVRSPLRLCLQREKDWYSIQRNLIATSVYKKKRRNWMHIHPSSSWLFCVYILG